MNPACFSAAMNTHFSQSAPVLGCSHRTGYCADRDAVLLTRIAHIWLALQRLQGDPVVARNSLRFELAPQGVSGTGVHVGYVDTDKAGLGARLNRSTSNFAAPSSGGKRASSSLQALSAALLTAPDINSNYTHN